MAYYITALRVAKIGKWMCRIFCHPLVRPNNRIIRFRYVNARRQHQKQHQEEENEEGETARGLDSMKTK